jgi:Protein of unknown function (DUF1579)
MRAYHWLASVAVILVSAPSLAAQGGPKAAAVRVGAVRLEPARSLLHTLVGRWRFEIRFAGNYDGAPDVSGTRVVTALFDDLRLQWTEEVDHSEIRSQGIIGFDSRSGRFYGTSVNSGGTGAEFMTGTLDQGEPLVTFSPLAPSSPDRQLMESFTLSLIDRDHFTWAPLDRGWRGVFTREP